MKTSAPTSSASTTTFRLIRRQWQAGKEVRSSVFTTAWRCKILGKELERQRNTVSPNKVIVPSYRRKHKSPKHWNMQLFDLIKATKGNNLNLYNHQTHFAVKTQQWKCKESFTSWLPKNVFIISSFVSFWKAGLTFWSSSSKKLKFNCDCLLLIIQLRLLYLITGVNEPV